MIEDLLAIAYSVKRNEDDFFHLSNAKWESGEVILSLEILTHHGPIIHPQWDVICTGVRQESLSLGLMNSLQLVDDHVLLWSHTKRKLSLYFSGKCEHPAEVIGALYNQHWELTNAWIPFHTFFNPNLPLSKLLAGSSGMLATGPEPLLLAYEEVLQQFGFTTSYFDAGEPAFWDGETWLEERTKLSALLLDQSYVVAEKFTAKKA